MFPQSTKTRLCLVLKLFNQILCKNNKLITVDPHSCVILVTFSVNKYNILSFVFSKALN
jgi:hypothetical protein